MVTLRLARAFPVELKTVPAIAALFELGDWADGDGDAEASGAPAKPNPVTPTTALTNSARLLQAADAF